MNGEPEDQPISFKAQPVENGLTTSSRLGDWRRKPAEDANQDTSSEDLIPCEFCDECIPVKRLILHQVTE